MEPYNPKARIRQPTFSACQKKDWKALCKKGPFNAKITGCQDGNVNVSLDLDEKTQDEKRTPLLWIVLDQSAKMGESVSIRIPDGYKPRAPLTHLFVLFHLLRVSLGRSGIRNTSVYLSGFDAQQYYNIGMTTLLDLESFAVKTQATNARMQSKQGFQHLIPNIQKDIQSFGNLYSDITILLCTEASDDSLLFVGRDLYQALSTITTTTTDTILNTTTTETLVPVTFATFSNSTETRWNLSKFMKPFLLVESEKVESFESYRNRLEESLKCHFCTPLTKFSQIRVRACFGTFDGRKQECNGKIPILNFWKPFTFSLQHNSFNSNKISVLLEIQYREQREQKVQYITEDIQLTKSNKTSDIDDYTSALASNNIQAKLPLLSKSSLSSNSSFDVVVDSQSFSLSFADYQVLSLPF